MMMMVVMMMVVMKAAAVVVVLPWIHAGMAAEFVAVEQPPTLPLAHNTSTPQHNTAGLAPITATTQRSTLPTPPSIPPVRPNP